jgi:hypothetical protein
VVQLRFGVVEVRRETDARPGTVVTDEAVPPRCLGAGRLVDIQEEDRADFAASAGDGLASWTKALRKRVWEMGTRRVRSSMAASNRSVGTPMPSSDGTQHTPGTCSGHVFGCSLAGRVPSFH